MNSQILKFNDEFDYLTKKLALLKPISIILYGSFGRGEGAIYSDKKRDKLLNDIDILLIVKKKIDVNSIEKIKKELLKHIDIEWIDITQKNRFDLIMSNPSVFNYDLKYHSTILYGDKNILRLMPKIKNSNIEYNEIKLLFYTRIWGFLGSYKKGGIKELKGYEAAYFRNQMAKIIFALIDVILISNNKYVASYYEKIDVYKMFFLAENNCLNAYLSYALENKFSPSGNKISASEVRSTIKELTQEFFKIFSSGLSLAYNKEIIGPEQIVQALKYDQRLLLKKWVFYLLNSHRKNEFNELICRVYLVGSILKKDLFNKAVLYYKLIKKNQVKEDPSFEEIRINIVKLIF